MDCQFFVVSKNRPKCVTTKLLEKGGVDYHIVVEKEDVEKYVEAGHDRKRLIVLPASNRGYSYVVNFCKNTYLRAGRPVVVMDDDIANFFYSIDGEAKCGLSLKTPEELSEFFEEFNREVMETDFEYGTMGKSAFDWSCTDISPRFKYGGIPHLIVFKGLRTLELDFDEKLELKCDIDYSLKCMYLGIVYARFVRFLLQSKMNKEANQGGGLQDVYERQERVQRAHNIILKRWPLNARVDDKKKPINGVPELRIVYKKFDIDFDSVEV